LRNLTAYFALSNWLFSLKWRQDLLAAMIGLSAPPPSRACVVGIPLQRKENQVTQTLPSLLAKWVMGIAPPPEIGRSPCD
jgi:hypothetical protein